jgi:pimeloyl-ACP methyl ester carboxylesterase
LTSQLPQDIASITSEKFSAVDPGLVVDQWRPSTVAMVEGAGHYPHAQSPDQVAALVTGFLKEHARA